MENNKRKILTTSCLLVVAFAAGVIGGGVNARRNQEVTSDSIRRQLLLMIDSVEDAESHRELYAQMMGDCIEIVDELVNVAMHDSDSAIRIYAKEILGSYGIILNKELSKLARDEKGLDAMDRYADLYVYRTFYGIGDAMDATELMEILKSEIKNLELNDGEEDVRLDSIAFTVEMLTYKGMYAIPAIPVLVDMLDNPRLTSPRVKRIVINALGEIGFASQDAKEAIQKLVDDELVGSTASDMASIMENANQYLQ